MRPNRTFGPAAVGAYAQVAALLHQSRREAPDHLGTFLNGRAAALGMRDVSVFLADFEQRQLVPIVGSALRQPIDMANTTGGHAYTTASRREEPVADGVRLWCVVVDGAARLGVMAVTVVAAHDETRSLADSLAGVVAALLVTRGECTDAYTVLRRTTKLSLAAEMQWAPPAPESRQRAGVGRRPYPARL